MTDAPRVGVVGLPGKDSSEQLLGAFSALGAECRLLDCERLSLDATGTVRAAGEPVEGYDALVIKKLGAEYGPLMLDRLELLAGCEERGTQLFPRSDALRGLLNRAACTLRLLEAGVPMPPTLLTEDVDEAAAVVGEWGRAVLKPLYSTKARGMEIVEAGADLFDAVRAFQAKGNQLLYVQQMLELPGQDLGVVFIGDGYVATYARVSGGSWNTSTSSGGHYATHEASPEVIEVADRARRVFGLAFTSVDVAETPEGPRVFEVSAFGGFRGLREACGLDAARLLAEHVQGELARG